MEPQQDAHADIAHHRFAAQVEFAPARLIEPGFAAGQVHNFRRGGGFTQMLLGCDKTAAQTEVKLCRTQAGNAQNLIKAQHELSAIDLAAIFDKQQLAFRPGAERGAQPAEVSRMLRPQVGRCGMPRQVEVELRVGARPCIHHSKCHDPDGRAGLPVAFKCAHHGV